MVSTDLGSQIQFEVFSNLDIHLFYFSLEQAFCILEVVFFLVGNSCFPVIFCSFRELGWLFIADWLLSKFVRYV